MTGEWIRVRNIPDVYQIGKTKAFELAREFKAQSDPKNFIVDGKITILRKEAFEQWWRGRK